MVPPMKSRTQKRSFKKWIKMPYFEVPICSTRPTFEMKKDLRMCIRNIVPTLITKVLKFNNNIYIFLNFLWEMCGHLFKSTHFSFFFKTRDIPLEKCYNLNTEHEDLNLQNNLFPLDISFFK